MLLLLMLSLINVTLCAFSDASMLQSKSGLLKQVLIMHPGLFADFTPCLYSLKVVGITPRQPPNL